MTRSRHTKRKCAVCGRDRVPGELFSAKGKCGECSVVLLVENMESNIFDNPDHTLAYRRGVAGSVNAVLHEDLPELFEEFLRRKVGANVEPNADIPNAPQT